MPQYKVEVWLNTPADAPPPKRGADRDLWVDATDEEEAKLATIAYFDLDSYGSKLRFRLKGGGGVGIKASEILSPRAAASVTASPGAGGDGDRPRGRPRKSPRDEE